MTISQSLNYVITERKPCRSHIRKTRCSYTLTGIHFYERLHHHSPCMQPNTSLYRPSKRNNSVCICSFYSVNSSIHIITLTACPSFPTIFLFWALKRLTVQTQMNTSIVQSSTRKEFYGIEGFLTRSYSPCSKSLLWLLQLDAPSLQCFNNL